MKTMLITLMVACIACTACIAEEQHSAEKIAEAQKLVDILYTPAKWTRSVNMAILAVQQSPEGQDLAPEFYLHFRQQMLTQGYKKMRKVALNAILITYDIEDIRILQQWHLKHPKTAAKVDQYATLLSVEGARIGQDIAETVAIQYLK